MNVLTYAAVTNICLMLLTGFVFYNTHSFWSFLILLFTTYPSRSKQNNHEDESELNNDEE